MGIFVYLGVNEIIGFQKLVETSDKMTVASSDRQHQQSLGSYLKIS